MATYRPIRIAFWQDKFVLKLTPEQKYFYLYLMTNSKTKQCGIYELPLPVICLETGYNAETVIKLLKNFAEFNKIEYDFDSEEILVFNWIKFNPVNSENIMKCVISELLEIKSCDFITKWKEIFKKTNSGLTRKFNKETKDFDETDYTLELLDRLTSPLQVPCNKETETESQTESQSKHSNKIDFDTFWDLYDKKVGDKTKLQKKWNKLTLEIQTKALEHITEYKTAQPDKQYRKNPDTYLNNKSWNDEIISKDQTQTIRVVTA